MIEKKVLKNYFHYCNYINCFLVWEAILLRQSYTKLSCSSYINGTPNSGGISASYEPLNDENIHLFLRWTWDSNYSIINFYNNLLIADKNKKKKVYAHKD